MTENSARHHLEQPDSVVIVGSGGRMGAMFVREARAAGLGVTGVDQPLNELGCLARAHMVIACVPAVVLEEVLRIICPRMQPGAVLCDITSVKVAPVNQMLNAWKGDVVGTHPLFGPAHSTDPQELRVAMVRSYRCSDENYALAQTFFTTLGYTPFETDADTHDMAMARIQNMNFITSLAYCAQTANDTQLRAFVTPSFRRRLDAARKLLTEDGDMFAGLFEANPYSQQAVRQFSNLLSLASAGDVDLLLARARQWWPQSDK